MVVLHPPPVYCVHEVVHNKTVVRRFRDLGVVFVDDVSDVPAGATVMLSAHGTAPEPAARVARDAVVVDAVCPLVAKVHHEMRVRAELGYDLVYVGHDGHDETVGALGVAPGRTHLVEHVDGVDALTFDRTRPVALLAQTTLSMDDWSAVERAVRTRAGEVWTPHRSDVCYATTNRQQAIREVAGGCDVVVVVGSETSANTRALVDVARRAGCPVVLRVDDADELPALTACCVGVTAGASAPDDAVRRVVEHVAAGPVERVSSRTEEEYFPLPPPIRRSLQDARRAGAIPRSLQRAAADDRTVSAADLLEEVTSLVARSRGRVEARLVPT
jgi:4-hydroxy-3-methylbut-2-enyl diphosphate reductase